MDISSDESSDISDSDMDDYEARSYLNLKEKNLKIERGNNTYRCPFCVGKKKLVYCYKDLLQHAMGVGTSNRIAKVKANHRALAKFLSNDLSTVPGPSPQQKDIDQHSLVCEQMDHFVWPWMGILVNVSTERKNSRLVGEGGSRLKEQLSAYKPIRVIPIWSTDGHSGTAIVEFGMDWTGFRNSMAFEGHFEAKHLGKRDWHGEKSQGSNIYGWVARTEDYHSMDPIGEHLRKKGDLKTVVDLAEEESRKMGKLVAHLAGRIEMQVRRIEELQAQHRASHMDLTKMIEKMYLTHQAYNEEIQMIQSVDREESDRRFAGDQ